MAVLCDVISTTSNPVILYSARPAAAGIAKNHLSTYASHHFGDPIDLDPIPAFDVVKDRLKDCDSDCDLVCGPFVCDTETKDLFLSLSNHNIRTALDICYAAIKEAPKNLKNEREKYNRNSLINALFGRPAKSAKDEKDIDNNRHIQNIFRARTPSDPLPYDYITLLSLAEPHLIDDAFVEKFNILCSRMNPSNFPESGLSYRTIIKYVASAQHHELITRIDRISIDEISDSSSSVKVSLGIWLNKFCLTPKGKFMLELSQEVEYQRMTALESWRPLVVEAIRNQRIRINTIDK